MLRFFLFGLIMVMPIFTSGCINDWDYVPITHEQLVLLDQPYVKTTTFIAPKSSSRFRVNLFYPEVSDLYNDQETLLKIRDSLIGFSVETYDKATNQLVSVYTITETVELYASGSTVFLGEDMNIRISREYEIVITIPEKKDTEEKFLKPTFDAYIAALSYSDFL